MDPFSYCRGPLKNYLVHIIADAYMFGVRMEICLLC